MLLCRDLRAATPAAPAATLQQHLLVSGAGSRLQRSRRACGRRWVATHAVDVDKPPRAASHGIIARLVGSTILEQHGGGHSVVPLLCPPHQQLPFAAAVHVFSAPTAPQHLQQHQQHQQHQQTGSELVEVWYQLCGSGVASKGDTAVALSPGDAVLCMQGDVAFAAAAAPPPAAAAEQQPPPQDEQEAGLVMLQLLLPAELLTGQLQRDHTGHCNVVAQHVRRYDGTARRSVVDVSTACQLLSLAHRQQQAPRAQHAQQPPQPPPQRQQQQEQQQLQQQLQHAAISSSHQQAAGSNGSSDSIIPSSSSDSAHVLLHLSRAGLVKRSLPEVVSYRLPRQTNRLALLLGPHNTSPAISLSFGVEVFEPGHVTPYHVHNGAHELFMVLAGCGEAVHGPDRRREALAPGDVAVFPPGVKHGLDNTSGQQLYCLQMMLPNESFVEFVRSGQAAGALDPGLLQRLAAAASCG